MNLMEVGPHSVSYWRVPRSNFEAGQKSAVSENRSTEGYSPFIKQEDSPNLVEEKKKKLESWTAVQQKPFKGKNKLKKKPPTDFQQSLSD